MRRPRAGGRRGARRAGRRPGPICAPVAQRFADAVARDLQAHQGRALVLAGDTPAAGGARARPLDQCAARGRRSTLIEPLDAGAGGATRNRCAALADDMRPGAVRDAADARLQPGLRRAGRSGLRRRAAARSRSACISGSTPTRRRGASHWHLPTTHPLESWCDLRAVDGTASIVQPLIRPLYDTRTAHELLACCSARPRPRPYDLVRDDLAAAAPAPTSRRGGARRCTTAWSPDTRGAGRARARSRGCPTWRSVRRHRAA